MTSEPVVRCDPRAGLRAIIPVKPLEEGKSRLAASVSARQRRELNRALLLETLQRVAVFPGAAASLVVSRSPEVLQIARAHGMPAILEAPPHGLNAAAVRGTELALRDGARMVAILPVDLPFWEGHDLRRLVAALPRCPVCALVPDLRNRGTNLLIQSPVRLAGYAFGPGSLLRHRRLARRAGLLPLVLRHPGFGFDMDHPLDYRRWLSSGGFDRIAAPEAAPQGA